MVNIMVVSIENIILVFISFAISSIPLYLSLHVVGAKSAGFLRVVFVSIFMAFITSVIFSFFGLWAGLFAFLAMLFVYKEMFDTGWIGAFIAWVLQFVIVSVLIAMLFIVLGIALVL
ncbi:MAG: hypothetical protein WA139_05905 [Candidatus Aenigmatarchaeota archaeon]